MRNSFICLFLFTLSLSYSVIAQTHLYSIEKEPLSITERFVVRKDGLTVGYIEKDPISLIETWTIRDLTGNKVGKMEREPISIGKEYSIKNDKGERVGSVEEWAGFWTMRINYGEKLEFNKNSAIDNWKTEISGTRINIFEGPLDETFKTRNEDKKRNNRSMFEPGWTNNLFSPSNIENKSYKDDEPLYHSTFPNIHNSWQIPSFENKVGKPRNIFDPDENLLPKYNPPRLFNPFHNRNDAIEEDSVFNWKNPLENISDYNRINRFKPLEEQNDFLGGLGNSNRRNSSGLLNRFDSNGLLDE